MKRFSIISLVAVLQHFISGPTWIQLVSSQTDSHVPANFSHLLPFGVGTEDLQGPRGDDGASEPLTLRVPFTFFGTEYREIIVNSNGLLSFEREYISYRPEEFPITSPPLIAPFWSDFNPSIGGNITYRQSNDSLLLENIHAHFANGTANLTEFYPEHAFIVTWNQVPPYYYGSYIPVEFNTLQVVLATDRIQTIAVFIYDDIQWGGQAQIGFNAGDGYAFFKLPGALSDQTLNIDENSNIGEPGVFVYRIDDLGLVECSTTVDCLGPTLGIMTIKKCCVDNREGLAYTSPGSDGCYTCIVYGWFQDSFTGVEQDSSYLLEVGYQKGAQQAGLDLLFLTTAQPTLSGDFMIGTGEVRVSYENPDPEIVAVHFYVDSIAQEGNETFTMMLVPSHSLIMPSGESAFFCNTIDMTIIDSDVLEISLRQNTFQASEIDGEMDVSVCKDKPISSSVTVTISAVTVDTANISASEGVVIPPIDVNLPNRADQDDFSGTERSLTFFYGSVNCLSHRIEIINDNINEATEQVFIIQLTLVRSVDPDKVNVSRRTSLGIIIDDDPIMIGFEEPRYTFIEPPFLESFHVLLVKEGNRISEQTFQMLIQVTNQTNPFQPASVGEDYQTRATVLVTFPSDQLHVPWEFELLSNEDPEENEAFRVTLSSVGESTFFANGSSLYNETLIIIKDAQNPVGFSQNVYTVHEDEDSINITIFSYISVTTSDDIMANFTTFSESATEGEDYLALSLQIPVTGNQSTAVLSIMIVDDHLAEGLETFGGMLEVVSQEQNLSFVSIIHIEILDDEVEGICGRKLEDGHCDDNALCRVGINGRTLVDCYCMDGFIGNGFICRDIDECLTGKHNCGKNAECFNTFGSFECSCESGFFGDGGLCINMSNQVPGPCDDPRDNCACFNGSNMYMCGCLPGYGITRNERGNPICQDINECENSRNFCNGTCENTPGSYNCFCPTGYVPNPKGDLCIDIDECHLGIHDCSRDALCSNTIGGFNCTCKGNFFGNGRSCLSVSECTTRCEHRCISTMDSFVCGCHSGYYLMSNQQDCGDVNECEVYSICGKNARCINSIGSYRCECRKGFQGNGFNCRDINECDTGLHDCHVNASCNNTSGSYTCTCTNQLFGNGTSCNAGVGPLISTTLSIIQANPLFFRVGFNTYSAVIGTDFCLEDMGTTQNGVLIHCPVANDPFPPPQFNITTARIFLNSSVDLLSSHTMQNILLNDSMLLSLFEEETKFLKVTCTIVNRFGSDTATTTIRVCDPTECQQGVTNTCAQLCSRNVTNGTTIYECSCNEGYIPNENFCDDINECLNASANNCSALNNEVCRNIEGSYTCDCSPGYQRHSQESEPCEDIDECIAEIDTCSETEACSNTAGSFTCLCNTGFTRSYDESDCKDVNECANDTLNNCFASNHQVCRNVPGSFHCDCDLGYEADMMDNTCQDVNECLLEDNHGCSQICNNTEGSYSCVCRSGYILDPSDNSTCHDIDECVESHGCHSNAVCTNTFGSYLCQCKTGYEGDGVNCQLSLVVSISSGLGATVLVLIIAIVIVVIFYVYCHRHFVVKKGLYRTDTAIYQNQSAIGNPQDLSRTRKISVQSSFKLKLPPPLIFEASTIKLDETIGQGEFGIVYKGRLDKTIGHVVHSEVVAIKTLKGFYDSNAVKEMLRECSKMHTFKHPNVLALHGVCLDGGTAPYIIMPFMANGSLLAYLKANRKTLVFSAEDKDDDEVAAASKQLTDMCIQVAKGMEYLACKKVVHRDLAARNCMIDINFVIKVADFGLSESIGTKDYFRQDKDATIKLPIKWLAPESMEDHVFSEKSDVWAYGVTCWEIFSGGKVPYPSVNLIDLPRYLANGHRQEQPNNYACKDEMYTFMLQCWEFEPERRPIFSSIVDTLSHFLETMVDYMDIGTATFASRSDEPTALKLINDESTSDDAITTVFKNEDFI